MEKDRLLAFSDGVIAIIITIMALELKAPHDADPAALLRLAPNFLSYALSFAYVAIYWNNHHHLFYAVARVSGRVLWANTHLLFWLSLVPFGAAWMSGNYFASLTVAVYGATLLAPALAYFLLTRTLLASHGADSTIARAIGADRKGMLSIALYAAGIAVAFVAPWAAVGIYVFVAIIWFIPDPRIEKALGLRDEAGR